MWWSWWVLKMEMELRHGWTWRKKIWPCLNMTRRCFHILSKWGWMNVCVPWMNTRSNYWSNRNIMTWYSWFHINYKFHLNSYWDPQFMWKWGIPHLSSQNKKEYYFFVVHNLLIMSSSSFFFFLWDKDVIFEFALACKHTLWSGPILFCRTNNK